jgi:hypothetical protein
MITTGPGWTEQDRAALAARGIAVSEAERQLGLLAAPPSYAALVRPCTVGDGIERLADERRVALRARAARAAAAGRIGRFVPASGAATRMFQSLLSWRARGGATSRAALDAAVATDADARAVAAFLDGLERFAFHAPLAAVLARAGHDLARLAAAGPVEPVLAALLDADGLGYAERPKGLLAFHRGPTGTRTAFEEQLEEAALGARAVDGACRLHFTVSPEHLAGFETLIGWAGPQAGARHGARFDVTFSTQSPATDTLALGDDGRPVRDAAGALLFRPAGHGALIGNLDALGADVVLIKNVDNVQPDGRREATLEAWAVLAGLALETQEQAHDLIERLDDPEDDGACDAAVAWARETLGLEPAAGGDRRAELRAWLDRPVRVGGMVPNTGEPGGGPFWVRGHDGAVRSQIVESAEVDPDSPAQQAVMRGATHFNPVFLACALRDPRGVPHALHRFVDDQAVIVTRKSAGGRGLRALERPGLWNGAMAGWLTRFVEVPLEVFTPVKTVNDLLRPEHQPR